MSLTNKCIIAPIMLMWNVLISQRGAMEEHIYVSNESKKSGVDRLEEYHMLGTIGVTWLVSGPTTKHVSREVERSANGRNTTASQEYWLAIRDRGHLLWQVHWLREWHWQAGSHTIPSDVHDSYS